MNRKIHALRGKSNVGKSQTIKSVYELLINKYPNAKQEYVIYGPDVRSVISINGIKIGIESQGDPSSRIFKSIGLFRELKCNIIICATRTKGATVQIVEDQKPMYDVVWYEQQLVNGTDNQNRSNLNTATKILLEVESNITNY